MGEDRIAFVDKNGGDVLSSSRQRHSSVISSCSEDAETESTSTGYPPTPDEEKEEELEYGPGIVNKLKTRFLSITLKQNRGMRRSCSMENLLDQDRSSMNSMLLFSPNNRFNGKEVQEHHHQIQQNRNYIWGNLKRAKSMDTLLMELQPEPPPVTVHQVINGDDAPRKGPKIVRRRDGGLLRSVPTICDEELPKPDTVKIYKRMFEPAESRRGSYSRRPPVLRASAKSGSMLVSKTNNNGVSPSAKVNGTALKSKLSAKQSPSTKAQQSNTEVITTSNSNRPLINGDSSKPLCNGNFVKAIPVKITDNHLCNGKPVEVKMNEKTVEKKVNEKTVEKKVNEKTVEKKVNEKTVEKKVNEKSIENKMSEKTVEKKMHEKIVEKKMNAYNLSMSKKESHHQNGDIYNGNSIHMEAVKMGRIEECIKTDVQKVVNHAKVVNGTETPVTNIVNGIKMKPKVPPNRPAFIKNVKHGSKLNEQNGIEKRNNLIPKLKPVAVAKRIQETVKPEIQPRLEESFPTNKPVLNGELKMDTKVTKPSEINKDIKVVEENNRKNTEKVPTESSKVATLDDADSAPVKEPEKAVHGHLNGYLSDVENITTSPKSIVADAKPESKPVKKQQQSADPITTSMVFDFRGKDVVSHVAVLPTPFGCKALHPKKRPLLVDGKGAPIQNGAGSDDEDEYHMDYSVPPPCGVTFEGENVKIGKGAILSTRNKELKIQFDDSVDDNTFVYPSESSLLEDGEQQSLSPSPPPDQSVPSKLKSNPAIGSSGAGGLTTYTPSVLRTMDNFEPGMFRPPPPSPPEKEDVQSGEEENTEIRREDSRAEDENMIKPADPGIISSWSLSAGTSDLLF